MLIGILVWTVAGSVALQAEDTHWHWSVDWRSASLEMQAERRIEGDDVGAYNRAARAIASEAEHVWIEAVRSIQLDTGQQIADIISRHPETVTDLRGRFHVSHTAGSSPDRDVSHVRQSWRIELHEAVLPVVADHDIPRPLPLPVSWQAERSYTGLVIDARGRLPVHGTTERESLRPILLPRIYDEAMNLVLASEMMNPQYLHRWGVIGYSDDVSFETHRDRIGNNPLVVAADALFGRIPAHILIPRDAAETLLLHTDNTTILTEGRIIVLVDHL